MKILMCLATLFILSTAAPGAWEEDPRYRAYLAMIYGPGAETAARGRSATGADACDRGTLNANDVISQTFMDNHICLARKSPPEDFPAFCRDFRQGQPKYQVMLFSTSLRTPSIKQLRDDLRRHQNDFYNDRERFRPLNPGAGQVHYTTDHPYTFIYCEQIRGRWIGGQITGYQQYIPIGTAEGVYKIYHGCPPVESYPGFRQTGSC